MSDDHSAWERGERSVSFSRRVKQNLSFVISPSGRHITHYTTPTTPSIVSPTWRTEAKEGPANQRIA